MITFLVASGTLFWLYIVVGCLYSIYLWIIEVNIRSDMDWAIFLVCILFWPGIMIDEYQSRTDKR